MPRYEVQLAAEDQFDPSSGSRAPLGEAALGAIRRAALEKPTDPDYHYILGTALAREGRLDQARAAFREACGGDPNDPTYRRALGECEWQLGRYEAAASAFREVLARVPEDGEAANGLALSLLRTGEPAQAADVLRPVAARDASRAEWHSNLGAALWESGQAEEAERRYRHAVRVAPGEPAYKRNLARLLLEGGKADEASRWLRSALDQAPGSAPAWVSLGDAYIALGRREQAEDAYERAVAIDATVMTARPQSRAAWEALRLRAAWEDLEQEKGRGPGPSPASARRGFASRVVGFLGGTVLGHALEHKLRTALLIAALGAGARVALVLLPPYVAHYKLYDEVVRVARTPTRDDGQIQRGVAEALRRHRLETSVPAEAVTLTSGDRWRKVEFRYAVPVEFWPGWPVALPFRLVVDEPYLVEPDSIF